MPQGKIYARALYVFVLSRCFKAKHHANVKADEKVYAQEMHQGQSEK